MEVHSLSGHTAWALLLEYDGGPFIGWQRQDRPPGTPAFGTSVQAVLEAAAAKLNGGAPVPSIAAGRTDAGVHAAGQVALLALPDRLRASQVRDALNFHMHPHKVAVLRAVPAAAGWNPRFSAISRRYRYTILNRASRAVLQLGHVWQIPRALDAAAMQAAAGRLVGHHDFTSFRATACQARSPWRTLDRLDVTRLADTIEIVAEARSFLHHQIRNLAGTLRLVGEGRWSADDVSHALAARNRAAAGPTAPPDGLCLEHVGYDPDPFAPV